MSERRIGINVAVAVPKIKAQIANLGGPVLPGAPSDFGKLIVARIRWNETDRAVDR